MKPTYNLIIKLLAMALCILCVIGSSVFLFSPDAPNDTPNNNDPSQNAGAEGMDIVDVSKAEYTYGEMVEDLEALKARYGDKITYRSVGTSLDGRSIYAVTLGNPSAEKQIVISAGIHAREYMTPLLVMAQLEYYLYSYDTGSLGEASFSELFNEYSIEILPMCNPDGITLAEEGLDGIRSESLRQTILSIYELDTEKGITSAPLDEYLSTWKANARGVDLNRNFDTDDFGASPTMSRPCFMNHPGEHPLSEPETRALTDFVLGLTNPVLHLAVHSQGEVIYFNCGQDNYAEALSLAETASATTGYKIEMDARHVSAFDDWCNKALGVPSITVETGSVPCPLPIDELDAIWNKNRDLWIIAILWHQLNY